MDKTAPAASSTFESKESPSPSAPRLFLLNSSALDEGGAALYARGLETIMGMTSNGGSAALPEESLTFAAETERGWELGLSEPQTKAASPAPALGRGQKVKKKTTPTSGLYPRMGCPSQESPEFSASHSGTSGTASPPEPKALPSWAW